MNEILPRPEYPRPQLKRNNWQNLNGEWEFSYDPGMSGVEQKFFDLPHLPKKILVPFCPESRLSGLQHTDFMSAVWYKRNFSVPQKMNGQHVLLHFGAVDYYAQVWVNGQFAGSHKGGYTPFFFDITALLNKNGENSVVLCAQDDIRSGHQPSGKQCHEYASNGCCYTRTTGIWQTVWLEYVPSVYLTKIRLTPDVDNESLFIECCTSSALKGCILKAEASFEGKTAGAVQGTVTGNHILLHLPLTVLHLWSIECPDLYDLSLTLRTPDGVTDHVKSYFGMRSVSLENGVFCLNHQPIFQRLILDQGYFPDGIYTAPKDGDLKADIERSMAMGFNGARMHEKIFDPRYLYWADKMGYLIWGEHANWGLDSGASGALSAFLPEWAESMDRDYNSPSLIGWCPFNETSASAGEMIRDVYHMTKRLDPTRPVIDVSGFFHTGETDIFDIHDYEQDVAAFASHYEPMKEGKGPYNPYPDSQHYHGEPYFVSEYGGIWWNPSQKDQKAWGYGNHPKSEEEFLARYDGLTTTLLQNPRICGFCYTQLTDVEQEVNGLYTYDRKAKFDPSILQKINSQKAAIEK